jgi:hypothetical protein
MQVTGLSTGVVHSDGSGNLTSSTVVNADVDATAAIAGTKVSPDFGSQVVTTTGTVTGTGLVKRVRFTFNNGATTSSAFSLPSGAVVSNCQIKITTPFSGGATISVGQSGHVSDFQTTSDNNPQGTANDIYEKIQDSAVAGIGAVLVTVGGSPAAGAGVCIVDYSVPLT